AMRAIAEGLSILACVDVLDGRPISRSRAWRTVRSRLAPTIAGFTLKWVMCLLGLALFIVPGAYLICVYFAVLLVTLLERANVRLTRGRSLRLARGNFRRVFLTIGLFDLGVMLTA